jgi:hypothetical protein
MYKNPLFGETFIQNCNKVFFSIRVAEKPTFSGSDVCQRSDPMYETWDLTLEKNSGPGETKTVGTVPQSWG